MIESASARMTQAEGSITFTGPLSAHGIGRLWPDAVNAARRATTAVLILDIAEVTVLDTTGASLLLAMEAAHEGGADMRGADAQAEALLN